MMKTLGEKMRGEGGEGREREKFYQENFAD